MTKLTPTESLVNSLRDRAALLRTYAGFIMFGIISFVVIGILIFINAGFNAQEESSPALREVRNVSDSLGVISRYLKSSDPDEKRQVMSITNPEKMSKQLEDLKSLETTVHGSIGELQKNWSENKIPVLVSTVSQRVGIIVLLIFLAQILVPHYRYNIKLAGFYSARADALEMLSSIPDTTLDKLILIISPDSLDFGKTVPSPTEHVLELLRESAKLGR